MMTDPIADMLTRIRNASLVNKKEVMLPYSKIKFGIANILVKEGYLKKVEEKKDVHPYLLVTLQYHSNVPAITHIKRISKPGHRRYIKRDDIEKVLSGFGVAILSTPKGLLTNTEARKEQVGGELICEVY
ncbi:MAG: 30S ribosomal protein S8 [Candidatus Magasanikbacteria bacterium RIFOXYD2_FULL_39_9]|uniref:Small ribosomal subunit protein uS8 n=1 Tax=Candidatus Magasanikbacteria bacterium RIFOXYD1_FULL_40_23 TaxID=1798705 RepID=A0A1F6P959_9BACT|nr:MAG: 30S ribosomal protein S8 [Candidatus Magasanikbacteria bacterium RIFOXYD2_FULL_39_9]OGH92706.1 MAG: 30S ribosomal protein S8 [Candidatus Magasanikbacteria bacterium RIFOXYD1_FULL_40_23]